MMNSHYPVDIMVVDNASKDETVSYLRQHYPQVTVVANGTNQGFGKANNIGILYAMQRGYDAVLLLNQDAWLAPDTLGRMIEVMGVHPEYGIISPVHLTGDGSKLDKGFAVYTRHKNVESMPCEDIVEVPFINAAIWLIRLSVLKVTGLFAPIFYHYGEDKDLANRMTHYHFKTGYVPSAFGYHDREFRQEDRSRRLRSEYIYHLSEFANINHGFGMAFAKGVLALVKKCFAALLKGHMADAKTYLQYAGRLMMNTKNVSHAREISRHVDLKNYE